MVSIKNSLLNTSLKNEDELKSFRIAKIECLMIYLYKRKNQNGVFQKAPKLKTEEAGRKKSRTKNGFKKEKI